MTPKQVLIKAREHISDPSMWWRGEFSVDGSEGVMDGKPCCAWGAIIWAHRQGASHEACVGAYNTLTESVQRFVGRDTVSIASFNDDPNTTHQDVLDVFDKAIEVAE